MSAEVALPPTDPLDMLALALAAAATWWRTQLSSGTQGLLGEQLAAFERHLCLGLAKLLLRNAQIGLSWRTWRVATEAGQNAVLLEAVTQARLGAVWFPPHTSMWLETTADQVLVRVRCGRGETPLQVWPLPPEVVPEPPHAPPQAGQHVQRHQ